MAATGGIATLSEVRRWGIAHLTEAADQWTATATVWEDEFTGLVARAAAPAGTPWEGRAAEAAEHRAHSDRMTVISLADQLHTASGIARQRAAGIADPSPPGFAVSPVQSPPIVPWDVPDVSPRLSAPALPAGSPPGATWSWLPEVGRGVTEAGKAAGTWGVLIGGLAIATLLGSGAPRGVP